MNTRISPAAPVGDVALSQTIADYLVTGVPTARAEESAADVCRRLIGGRYDDASHVFVLSDGSRLIGVAEIGMVMGAPGDTPLRLLAGHDSRLIVTPQTDREEAASVAIHNGASILGVCERDGRFVGAVPASALLSILRDEHLEDLHHMVGILARSKAAQEAWTAPPYRRALYRLPWLLVGLAGSALATALMVRFEHMLTAHIAVAFFIPAIVYLADAVGTQSEAVAVRGLSLSGGGLLPLLVGEFGTGILIGAALGVVAYPLVWLAFGSVALAAAVATAIFGASIVATTIGFALPALFARLGYDPALGSGPVATVIQDVLSLLIYFLTAYALVF